MNDSFNVNIYCVIFAVDITENKRYVLSTDQQEIVFPKLQANKTLLHNTADELAKFVQNHVFVNILELMPQLITIHDQSLDNDERCMNVVYGFIIEHNISLNNCYWIEFDFMQPNKYSDLLLYTAQQLQ